MLIVYKKECIQKVENCFLYNGIMSPGTKGDIQIINPLHKSWFLQKSGHLLVFQSKCVIYLENGL